MENIKYYTCKHDRPFKEIFLKESNKDLLKEVLETVLKVEINKIKIMPNERNSGNIKVKRKTYDALIETNEGKIEIEVNANGEKEYVRPRNMSYIGDLYSHHTLVGEEYNEDVMIIQINFTYNLKDNKLIREYYMQDKSGKKYVDNIKIIEINMDEYLRMWYDKKNEKLIEENKYLIMMGLERQELEKLSTKNGKVMKYMEELDRLNRNPEFWEYMSHEEDERKIRNSLISEAKRKATEEGRVEGLKEGHKEGIKENSIQIAKNMINEKIDISLISKITGLSIDEINKIKNS